MTSIVSRLYSDSVLIDTLQSFDVNLGLASDCYRVTVFENGLKNIVTKALAFRLDIQLISLMLCFYILYRA